MTIRFKLIAAALGLVVAAGTVGEVSAKTVVKHVASHGIGHKKVVKLVGGTPHRLRIGTRFVKHIRIAHRAPTFVKIVKAPAVVKIVKAPTHKKIVRIIRAPLVKHAMFHRAGAKVTLVR